MATSQLQYLRNACKNGAEKVCAMFKKMGFCFIVLVARAK